MTSYWTKRRRLQASVEKNLEQIAQYHEEASSTLSQENDDFFNVDVNSELSLNQVHQHFGYSVPTKQNDSDVSDTESDTSGEDSEAESAESTNEFASALAEWATECSVSLSTLSLLLDVLRTKHSYLPKDPRTLLGTLTTSATENDIKTLSGGSYYHFGIAKGIMNCIEQIPNLPTVESLSMQVNIDGVPVFKSTNGQFWPIQGMLDNKPHFSEPFLIGLFYGESKPKNLDFMESFLQEYDELKQSGLEYNGSMIKLDISVFVCDAPARSFIKNVKQHSGYSSCERCTQRGVWDGKMTFPELNARLRTDAAFDEMQDEDHHMGFTPLAGRGLGLVSQVVLDYMHLVCLGVMRRLVMLWIRGPLHCRQSASVISSISDRLLQLKHFIPSEFPRRPRSLCEFRRWKATEFRQFLLYTGQVVLAGQLPDEMYKNFLLLSISIYILVDRKLCSQYNEYASQLLVLFVQHFSDLYGANMVSYNIHNLIHLGDDARNHGPLDDISAFPFENFMNGLLKKVRKPSKPLEQVIRRFAEITRNVKQKACKNPAHLEVGKPHKSAYIPQNVPFCKQFKVLHMENFIINLNPRNNCITLNNEIVLVRNILLIDSKVSIIYQRFRDRSSFFVYPIKSDFLGVYRVWNLDTEFAIGWPEDIKCKNVILPYKQEYVVIPLIHSKH